MDHMQLWDKLGKTDPAHTKTFKRSGGFEGTAIKPMWSYKRLTEEFGPCGTGWGIEEPKFQVVHAGEEVLVYCTVGFWYESRDKMVYGVGGDKVAGKNKYGLNTDDEAFKKAFTDAATNAMKFIGVGADVHMGMFDDQKYINTMKEEFHPQTPPKRKELTDEQKAQAALEHAKIHVQAAEGYDKVEYAKQNADIIARIAMYPQAKAALIEAGFSI